VTDNKTWGIGDANTRGELVAVCNYILSIAIIRIRVANTANMTNAAEYVMRDWNSKCKTQDNTEDDQS
ncbi:hypothetical protein BGZ83_002363, partial [Gryganskiella cystojenkinii]